MAEIPNRIMGTEMEYTFMLAANEKDEHYTWLQGHTTRKYIARSIAGLGIASTATAENESNLFLGNGSRLYEDHNNVREYATPEETTPRAVFASEMVGEIIVQHAATLFSLDYEKELFVNKRVLDDADHTYGYHANYSASAEQIQYDSEDYEILELFGVFAATRAPLFGSGGLRENGKFVIGQKTSQVWSDFSTSSTHEKPVVHLRREPLASANKWVRIHDISGDANMMPYPGMHKHGAASAVIRLLENGRTMPKLRFAEPLDVVARAVAHDTSLTERFEMEDGRSMTALEVQREIIAEARQLEKDGGLSPIEQESLDEWERTASDLTQDPRLVTKRVEWVQKLAVLAGQHDRHGHSWKSEELRAVDRLFGDLHTRGIGMKLRKGAWADDMPDTALLESRLQNPPDDTRANIRGRVIQNHQTGKCSELKVNWAEIRHGGEIPFRMLNPYKSRDSKIEDYFYLREAS